MTNQTLHDLIITISHRLADATLLRRSLANREMVLALHCHLGCLLTTSMVPRKRRSAPVVATGEH